MSLPDDDFDGVIPVLVFVLVVVVAVVAAVVLGLIGLGVWIL